MRRWLITTGCGLLLLTGSAVRFLVYPPTDPVGAADAIVLLAGSPEERMPLALQLARDGQGVLAVSTVAGETNAPARALCGSPPRGISVVCFNPAEPADTRAEARALAEVVADQGWDRVAVVTSSYHVVRAGLLIRRCTDADVAMVEARPVISGLRWTRLAVREVGGLGAALGQRSC